MDLEISPGSPTPDQDDPILPEGGDVDMPGIKRKRYRLQKCQRKRKKRLALETTAAALGIEQAQQVVDLTQCYAHLNQDPIPELVPMEIDLPPVVKELPEQVAKQPPKPIHWIPFTPTYCLPFNTFLYSNKSSGRFCSSSYLGKVLNSNVGNTAGVQLRNEILLKVLVHDGNPSNADNTCPALSQRLAHLASTSPKLKKLAGIFQRIVEFHRKIHQLSSLVRNLTTKHLPQAKIRPKLKFRKSRHALRYKLNRGIVPHKVVLSVVHDICRLSGAWEMIGGRKNQRMFIRFLKRLLLAGWRSRLRLSLLLEVLNPDDVQWLRRISGRMRIHLQAKVSLWLLTDYVYTILRLGYYVTSAERTRGQVNFYLQDTWRSVSSTVKDRFVRTNQLKLTRYTTPNSRLRLMPKLDDLRPIVSSLPNHCVNSSKMGLDQIKTLARYLALTVAPHASGTHSDFYLRNAWKVFWKELYTMGKDTEKLYYLKMDIESAFGSVDMDKLEFILKEAVDLERVYRVVYLKPKAGVQKRLAILMKEGDDLSNFEMHLNYDLTNVTQGLEKGNPFPIGSALENLIRLIKTRAIVKIGKKFYSFSNGLPQGSPVSVLLCLIYYGRMERHYLSDFIRIPGEFFVRCVDDYFFVTPNSSRVQALYSILNPGIPAYRFHLKEAKTLGSIFDSENSQASNNVVFCGWNFDLKNGHVTRDFGGYVGVDPCSTLSFYMTKSNTVEEFIISKINYMKSLRLGACILDPWLNCKLTVGRTIFDTALFAAFKFTAACRVLYPSLGRLKDVTVATELFKGIIQFVSNLFRRVCFQNFRPLQDLNCQCVLNRDNSIGTERLSLRFDYFEVNYLVIKAFAVKLTKQRTIPREGFLALVTQRLNSDERWIDRHTYYSYLRTIVTQELPPYFKAMVEQR